LGINISVKEMICGRRRCSIEIGVIAVSERAISQYKFQSFHKVVDIIERYVELFGTPYGMRRKRREL
jgi:hypothetical protein